MDSTEWYDTDGDGIGNTQDTDDDGDGYPDAFDDLPLDPTDWSDLDGDGLGDIIDLDDDMIQQNGGIQILMEWAITVTSMMTETAIPISMSQYDALHTQMLLITVMSP